MNVEVNFLLGKRISINQCNMALRPSFLYTAFYLLKGILRVTESR